MAESNMDPMARPEQISAFAHHRITVLEPDLIRVETSETGEYTDLQSLVVVNRRFSPCPYKLEFNEKYIAIITERARFYFDYKKEKVTEVETCGKRISVKKEINLPGTARTLDFTDGYKKLGHSVIGEHGVAVLIDDSILIDERGNFKKRRVKGIDEYVFACPGRIRALKLLYRLTGKPPMIPRYALGNWWSRFYKYSAEELTSLMDDFRSRDIPFSVLMVDMDWHWTDVKKRFGYNSLAGSYLFQRGWTGYTWNSELFPDYRKFLDEMHKRGLMIGLNLHPHGGVRSFETQYPEMAKRAGVADGERVPFDFVNDRARRDYFDVLMHPYERDGVDFWWIDWQQGKRSGFKGLDPLWALNHFHYLDSDRPERRGMILSRYSGVGSHRYPVGFSGDTIISWRSLRFQPYFTASASNVGYTYWSHDIGGHTLGNPRDDELYLRWIQFGVYSPILRLHSSNTVGSKDPACHPKTEREAEEALRFRVRLIPYIYTHNYYNYRDAKPLIQPLYYKHTEREAYTYKNEYYFGSELIVAPVTHKADKKTGLAKIEVWLPKARWIDIHTREISYGGKFTAYRDASSIPVYLREGGILPLASEDQRDTANPHRIELLLNPGNGKYVMFEDDGISNGYKTGGAFTKIRTAKEGNILKLTLISYGDTEYIPDDRAYKPNILEGEWSLKECIGATEKDGWFYPGSGQTTLVWERRDAAE